MPIKSETARDIIRSVESARLSSKEEKTSKSVHQHKDIDEALKSAAILSESQMHGMWLSLKNRVVC